MVCPIQCLVIGYGYVTWVMGLANKNLFVKSDFSWMPPRRFDSEHEVFRADLKLNSFQQIGFNRLIACLILILNIPNNGI